MRHDNFNPSDSIADGNNSPSSVKDTELVTIMYSVLKELKLLNERVEEAFNTSIRPEDVE